MSSLKSSEKINWPNLRHPLGKPKEVGKEYNKSFHFAILDSPDGLEATGRLRRQRIKGGVMFWDVILGSEVLGL